jgi:urease accessory protein
MLTTIMRTTITMRMIIHRTLTTTIMAVTIIMMSIANMSTTTVTPMLMITNKPPPKSRRRAIAATEPTAELSTGPATDPAGLSEPEAAALYRLMTWLSPSFPVGSFSYSSGIEWAVEAGDIIDAASLRDWLAAMLADGPGCCDGVFLAQAHRTAVSGDRAALRELAELAAAFVPSRERQLETSAQGRAFIDIARSAWNCDGLDPMVAACDGAIVYPVAVGIVSAAHGIALAPTMHAFFHAVTSNWISAGARLVPLGQTDSQRLLAALEPVVAATGARALAATLDDLGSATFRADLAGLRHETQYTRLFRS